MRIAENITAYRNFPSCYDCINIVVDGSPNSDLTFPELEKQIEEIRLLEKDFCIEIFFDLHAEGFSFLNPLDFSIRKRALEVLIEKLPEENIHHIILYRGPIDFCNQIKSHAATKEAYEAWKIDFTNTPIDEEHLLHLYSATLLSNFFHSFIVALPDHIKGALLFTLPAFLETAKVCELISEETFSHLDIGIKYPKFFHEGICWGKGSARHTLSYTGENSKVCEEEVKTAIVLPFIGSCNYIKFEEIVNYLIEKSVPFKVIEENLINEKWHGIDNLIFDYEALSFDGGRMIDGFIAAGGKAYTFQNSGILQRENVTMNEGFLPLELF